MNDAHLFAKRDGKEIDASTSGDGHTAVYAAMMLLCRRDVLTAGDILVVDDDWPRQEPGNIRRTVGVGHINCLASRLEQRAAVIAAALPLSADDLRLAARICRHIVRVGWVKTSVDIV